MFAHHIPGVGYLLQKYGNPFSKDLFWLWPLIISVMGIFFITTKIAALCALGTLSNIQSMLLSTGIMGGVWMFGEISWISVQFLKGETIIEFDGVYAWDSAKDTKSA